MHPSKVTYDHELLNFMHSPSQIQLNIAMRKLMCMIDAIKRKMEKAFAIMDDQPILNNLIVSCTCIQFCDS